MLVLWSLDRKPTGDSLNQVQTNTQQHPAGDSSTPVQANAEQQPGKSGEEEEDVSNEVIEEKFQRCK